ncbi:MAG: radical SAM protein [Candidatus Aenigmarchaeota archaeon]|nr:radical SAM protein [Candidatus Aenigmarchaeota archaeon]
MKVLITELPWSGKRYAGRAGMRWAHTSDKTPLLSFRPFPFYLGCTAALLEKNGHNVMVIDSLAEHLSDEEYFSRVLAFQPDFILSEIHTPSYNNDRIYMKKLKEMTGAKMIFAGPHPTALPQQVLKENKGVADFVLVSEYEFLALRVVEGKAKKGIVRAKRMVDINSIPWPARHLFKMDLYNEVFCRNYPNIQMMASRGCPLRCSYCNIFTMNNFQRVHRKRNVSNVVDEMQFCIDEYKPRELYLDDDNIDISPQWLSSLLDEKMQRVGDFPFTCMGHVNVQPELLEKMRKAGCVGIKLGIESTNNAVLQRLGKGMTKELAISTLKKCRELGIKTHLTFCVGLPGDTKESVSETINFAMKYGDSFQISIAAPFPGTPLWNEAVKNKWISFKSWDRFDGMKDAIMNYPGLSNKELSDIVARAQSMSYKKALQSGEWKKYVKMIYSEKGVSGISKLIFVRGPGMVYDLLKKK